MKLSGLTQPKQNMLDVDDVTTPAKMPNLIQIMVYTTHWKSAGARGGGGGGFVNDKFIHINEQN